MTSEDLLGGPDGEGRGARGEAEDFLRDILNEAPAAAKEIRQQAHEAGIADRTLDRAKGALRVRAKRHGLPGCAGKGVLAGMGIAVAGEG